MQLVYFTAPAFNFWSLAKKISDDKNHHNQMREIRKQKDLYKISKNFFAKLESWSKKQDSQPEISLEKDKFHCQNHKKLILTV